MLITSKAVALMFTCSAADRILVLFFGVVVGGLLPDSPCRSNARADILKQITSTDSNRMREVPFSSLIFQVKPLTIHFIANIS